MKYNEGKKRLLLLGGSQQQITAIQKAGSYGYHTVLCDYLPDNPGQYWADQFYQVSTTDKEKVLEIAQKEHIDGVIAYATDPAAPTAAFVADRMGLTGNPYQAVLTMCEKDAFRTFLLEHDFSAPKYRAYTDAGEALKDLYEQELCCSVVIKPADSSGSKGISVLHDISDVYEVKEKIIF